MHVLAYHNIVLKTEVNADSKVTAEELTTIVIDSEAVTEEEQGVTVVDSEVIIEEELMIDSEMTTEARSSEEELTGTAVHSEATTDEKLMVPVVDSKMTTEELRAIVLATTDEEELTIDWEVTTEMTCAKRHVNDHSPIGQTHERTRSIAASRLLPDVSPQKRHRSTSSEQ